MFEREAVIYAAGLLEGEGYFEARPPDPRWPGTGRSVAVRCDMTDLEPLERLAAAFGGRITGPYRQRPSEKSPRKDRWFWRAQGIEAASAVIYAVWPWLGPRRRQQALAVLYANRA